MALTRTTLSAACTASSDTIRLVSASGLVRGMWLLVEGEVMGYVRTVVSISGSTEVQVRRGIEGTKATAHASGQIVDYGVPSDFPDEWPYPNDITYNNDGDTAERTFPLPEGVSGVKRRFIVDAAQFLKVQAQSRQTIHLGTSTSAAGGYARCNVVGGELALELVGSTDWYMTEREEAWSVDS